MGPLGWFTAAITSIGLGLLGAWLRIELSVWHDPLIRFLVVRAATNIPPQFRLEAQAEMLAWISDIRSPTKKIVQAFHFYLNSPALRGALISCELGQQEMIPFVGVGENERLAAIAETLEECRKTLINEGKDRETALLISVALVELRMKMRSLNREEFDQLIGTVAETMADKD